jgi:hypothetical protein
VLFYISLNVNVTDINLNGLYIGKRLKDFSSASLFS